MGEKVILSWSGGKDSALTLYEIQKTGNYEILGLLTTMTSIDRGTNVWIKLSANK